MTEENIVSIIRHKRQYESQIAILRDCIDDLSDPEQPAQAYRYAILRRRITLIDYWTAILPDAEKTVVEKKLIEGLSWRGLANYFAKHEEWDISCDERTLQRTFAKAIKRIGCFVDEHFKDGLDYLIETGEETTESI